MFMVSAVNENGNPVDWAFWYKVPKLSGGVNNDSATGYEYAYCDSDNPTPAKSPHTLDSSSGVMAATLSQLTGMGYILYNDERPDGKPDNGDLGHTKGVLCWDVATGTGFWLIHSWPLTPHLGATIPPTPIYGQTFLCLSLDMRSLQSIATQMMACHEPQVYDFSLPTGTPDSLVQLANGTWEGKHTPELTKFELSTTGGMPFMVIAKNREWNDDFWNDGVGPALGVDLHVETWIRGPIAPAADSDGIHKVTDIKFVNMAPLGMPWTFSESQDHSKWAISADPTKPFVCIGDINRMKSQEKRGGGCVAFQNAYLYAALSKSDLIVAAPGMTREQTRSHIKTTHVRKTP